VWAGAHGFEVEVEVEIEIEIQIQIAGQGSRPNLYNNNKLVQLSP
jgi:hypothetical protein